MNTVLITGGAGFIGSHITDKLLEKGSKVIVVDNFSSGTLSNLKKADKLNLYTLDIEKDDLEQIFADEKPDYVIHLAAQTSVGFSVQEPVEDAMMNIVASIKLLNLSKKYGVKKFLTASTAAVYGMPQYLPVDEEHPTMPISPYGLSKLTMEKYIKLSGVPYIIFRFSNVYGPRQKSSKESGVIAIFNNAMEQNSDISIFGDGKQIRDFIYVEDIANICIKAIESKVTNEIVNFSTNKGVDLNELFDLMKPLYNYAKSVNYMPERIGDIKDSILSNKKAIELFGEVETTELKEGLKKLASATVKG